MWRGIAGAPWQDWDAHRSGEGPQLGHPDALAIGQAKLQSTQAILPRQPCYLLVPGLLACSRNLCGSAMVKSSFKDACMTMRPIHSVTEDIFMLRLARKVLSLACSEKKGTGCPPKYSYE